MIKFGWWSSKTSCEYTPISNGQGCIHINKHKDICFPLSNIRAVVPDVWMHGFYFAFLIDNFRCKLSSWR